MEKKREQLFQQILSLVRTCGGEMNVSIGMCDVMDRQFFRVHLLREVDGEIVALGDIDEYYYRERQDPDVRVPHIHRVKCSRPFAKDAVIDRDRISTGEWENLLNIYSVRKFNY